MLNRDWLDRLLNDSYANYVVQTALDFADPQQRGQLVGLIAPLLASVAHLPHGKRLVNRIGGAGVRVEAGYPSPEGQKYGFPTTQIGFRYQTPTTQSPSLEKQNLHTVWR
jgi:hypothetical protein